MGFEFNCIVYTFSEGCHVPLAQNLNQYQFQISCFALSVLLTLFAGFGWFFLLQP